MAVVTMIMIMCFLGGIAFAMILMTIIEIEIKKTKGENNGRFKAM